MAHLLFNENSSVNFIKLAMHKNNNKSEVEKCAVAQWQQKLFCAIGTFSQLNIATRTKNKIF